MKADFQSFSDIFKNRQLVKAPAYPWQDLALRIIKELDIPGFKRSSVFKACKDLPQNVVELALNDTKELCKSGMKWKYFFKVLDVKKINKKIDEKK
ncbi:MAG: hypothetical protein WCT50_00830 [Patescibacteria group bacterium]|jgi:hypothetical protein